MEIDQPILDIEEKTEYTDAVHAIIGRALIVATHYENLIKQLAITLSVQDVYDADGYVPEVFFPKILERMEAINDQTLDKKLKSMGLIKRNRKKDTVSGKIFREAKDARNDIAHNIGLNLIYDSRAYEGVIGKLSNDVTSIVKGIGQATLVLELLATSRRVMFDLNGYQSKLYQWVMEDESEVGITFIPESFSADNTNSAH